MAIQSRPRIEQLLSFISTENLTDREIGKELAALAEKINTVTQDAFPVNRNLDRALGDYAAQLFMGGIIDQNVILPFRKSFMPVLEQAVQTNTVWGKVKPSLPIICPILCNHFTWLRPSIDEMDASSASKFREQLRVDRMEPREERKNPVQERERVYAPPPAPAPVRLEPELVPLKEWVSTTLALQTGHIQSSMFDALGAIERGEIDVMHKPHFLGVLKKANTYDLGGAHSMIREWVATASRKDFLAFYQLLDAKINPK